MDQRAIGNQPGVMVAVLAIVLSMAMAFAAAMMI
jgi:hypothetical protein